MMALGLFGFALAVAYVPGWSGASTSLRWLVAASACAALFGLRPARLTWAHVFGGAFVGWALLSYAWSEARLDFYGGYGRLAVGVCLFVLGSRLTSLATFYKGAALGLLASGAAGYLMAHQTDSGLFVNPLLFAEACALIAAALLATHGGRYWLWCFAIPVVLLEHGHHGRGALIAFCAALTAFYGRAGMVVALGLGFLASGLLIGLAAIGLLPTVDARLWLWYDTLSGSSLLGHGLGSFSALFPLYAENSNPSEHHAHSMYVETAFEIGYVGYGLLVAFLMSLLIGTPRSAEKLLLIAFTMDGLYAFPDQMPFTFAAAALAAGHLARSVSSVGNRYMLGGAPYGSGAEPRVADERA